MTIQNPKAEYWKQTEDDKHIARCARVCYASNNVGNESNFVNSLWKNKHYSMFRHKAAYYIIPRKIAIPDKYWSYINKVMYNAKWYVSTNEQVAREVLNRYSKYRIPIKEAMKNNIFKQNKLLMHTIYVETGIDITRELNRKSPNAIAERSTRYVDFVKRVGIRFKRCHWMYKLNLYRRILAYLMHKTDELFYKIARSKYGLNLPPQDARFCLFLNTLSAAVYTYSEAEWEYIINVRLWDYTGVAHQDAKQLAAHILDELRKAGCNINKLKK